MLKNPKPKRRKFDFNSRRSRSRWLVGCKKKTNKKREKIKINLGSESSESDYDDDNSVYSNDSSKSSSNESSINTRNGSGSDGLDFNNNVDTLLSHFSEFKVDKLTKYENIINNPFTIKYDEMDISRSEEEKNIESAKRSLPIVTTIKNCEDRQNLNKYNINNSRINCNILKFITNVSTNHLRNVYQEIVVNNRNRNLGSSDFYFSGDTNNEDFVCLDISKYISIVKIYEKWINLFMNNYNRNLNFLNEYNNSNTKDSVSKHFIVEICRMQRILLNCSMKLQMTTQGRFKRLLYFWYNGVFSKFSEVEKETLCNLPNILHVRAMDLEHLPISMILNKSKRIMEFTVSDIFKEIRFIFHNMQIDFHVMINKKARVHVFYFFELIIARLGEFCTESFDSTIFDSKSFREWIGGKSFIANERLRKLIPLLVYMLRFLLNSDNLIYGKYVLAKECLVVNNSIADVLDEDVQQQPQYQQQQMRQFVWNINSDVKKVATFFTNSLKNKIGYHNEVLSPFFNNITKEIIFISLIPGCNEYSKIVNVSQDYWTRFVKNTDTRLDVLQGFIPDTHMFIAKYISNFNKAIESVNNKIYGGGEEGGVGHGERSGQKKDEKEDDKGDWIKNNSINIKGNQKMETYSLMIFEEYVKTFMDNIFYVRAGFENWLSGDDKSNLLSKNIKKELMKYKKNQCQFMYPANVIHSIFYIQSLSFWYEEITGRKDFIEEFVIICHEVYYGSSNLDKKIKTSNMFPIICQFHPMRYDVIFGMKKYYCNNDIRCCIVVWLYIIYVHCNGILKIKLEKFDIKNEIEKIFLKKNDNHYEDDEEEDEGESDYEDEETKNDQIYKLLLKNVSETKDVEVDEFELKFNKVNLSSISIDEKNKNKYSEYSGDGINVLKFDQYANFNIGKKEINNIKYDDILNLGSSSFTNFQK